MKYLGMRGCHPRLTGVQDMCHWWYYEKTSKTCTLDCKQEVRSVMTNK